MRLQASLVCAKKLSARNSHPILTVTTHFYRYETIYAVHFCREAKLNSLTQYIVDKKLPANLARRIRHFFNKYVLRRSAYDEDLFLQQLTETLRRECVMYLHRDVIDVRLQSQTLSYAPT